MSLVRLAAHFECDGCGRKFVVDVEHADEVPSGWTGFEMAVDAARGGSDGDGWTSVRGESVQVLCSKCTRTVDAYETERFGDDEHETTDDDVKSALDAAAGV